MHACVCAYQNYSSWGQKKHVHKHLPKLSSKRGLFEDTGRRIYLNNCLNSVLLNKVELAF